MKKHLTFLLCLALFCVAISGCGDNKAATDFSSFKVSGYEEAPKEIYSASAMDNNLGDTLMFADGTAKKEESYGGFDGILFSTDHGDILLISLVSGTNWDALKDAGPSRAYFMYSGMSSVTNTPCGFFTGFLNHQVYNDDLAREIESKGQFLLESASAPTPEPTSTPEPTPTPEPKKDFSNATKYKTCMYKVGKDIPAGEYFLVINSQSTAYLSLSSDSSGSLDSIITNDNFGTFRYIQVADGQYLEVKRADIYLVDKKLPPITEVLEMGDAYMPGMYKVGRDIPAGEYQIIPDSGSSAYYAVLSSSIDSIDSIITNGNTEAAKYITVKEGPGRIQVAFQ